MGCTLKKKTNSTTEGPAPRSDHLWVKNWIGQSKLFNLLGVGLQYNQFLCFNLVRFVV
jgi:hypothetical protein